MAEALSKSASKVQNRLKELGFSYQIKQLPASTKSAKQAAEVAGCSIGQIAKSLIFKGKRSGKPFLIIVSGSNRANEDKIKEIVKEPVEKANPDFVRQKTGFAIGGVPPIGHTQKIDTFIDQDLLTHKEIWAAGGNSRAIFKLTPVDLVNMTEGQVISVK